jgi:hypothetical protein
MNNLAGLPHWIANNGLFKMLLQSGDINPDIAVKIAEGDRQSLALAS